MIRHEIHTWRPLRWAAAIVLAMMLAAGCGGDSGAAGEGGNAAPDGSTASAPGTAGVPVSQPTGAIDGDLAARGEELFRSRGCVSCHTVGGGRRVGPDLEGVTDKREFDWLYHMVTNPDSMVKNDSIAKRLLGEYFTPMSDQNVQPDQFRAIYEHLRSESP